MNTKFLKNILLFLTSLTFFVPLVVVSSKFIFPFVVPKIVLFRSLTLVMLGIYLILLLQNKKKYTLQWNIISLAVVVFFLSFTLSTFIGVDWYKSFWDNHERMLGLFTFFHYIIFFFVISSVFKDEKEWIILQRYFLIGGSVVMLIGIIQKFNSDFLLNRGSSRVISTLGNAIYVGGYGLFLSFLGLHLFLKEKINYIRVLSLVGGALGFIGIFVSGTRGTLLGFLGALFVGCLLYGVLAKNKKWKYLSLGTLGFIIALFVLLFAFRNTAFVQSIPTVGRLVSTSLAQSDSANTRIMAWEIAVEAWQENPVFGWGPNNYFYAFNKYYRPEFLEHGVGETWFDNAHNVVFNTLAVQGSLGLLAYLGLFLMPMLFVMKGYKKKQIELHNAVLIVSFLVGHFIHNFFVFENPTSYLYFFFVLAYIVSLQRDTVEVSDTPRRVSPLVASGIFLGVILLVYTTNINVARANMTALSGLRQLMRSGTLPPNVFSIRSPHIDDMRNDISRTASEVVLYNFQNKKVDEAKVLFEQVYPLLKKNLEIHPMDIRVYMQSAQFAQVGAPLYQDTKYLLEAKATLEKALTFSPKRQQLIHSLASVYVQLGDVNKGVQLLEGAIEDDPKIGENWARLIYTYSRIGQTEQAKETLARAQANGVIFTGQWLQLIETFKKEWAGI